MSNKEYTTGFKKPPKATQFRAGQSGNPAGRPKGTKNLATDVAEELAQQISVNEGGNQLIISKQRAMVKTLVARSLKGDARAAVTLISLIKNSEISEASKSITESMSNDDKAMLDDYINHAIQSVKINNGDNNHEQ
jgi:hypothetical protein